NEAAASFDAVLDKAPEREVTLSYAAQLAASLGRKEAARALWQRAIAVNPYAPSYRVQLGLLFVQDKDWPRALEQARAAGRINPLSTDVHMLLIDCYLSTGRKNEAREEFENLMALEPPNAEQLRRRFGEMMK
ncbi:MAG TPA: tetratricopeptide repeat protein, partial [Gemmataceae bacterium]|nr:tetratricopeptide repeat protein [Gemmataceae bacterium]